MRFIVSTIGTSTLTNSIDRQNPAEGTWAGILGMSANEKKDALSDESKNVMEILAKRAQEKLNQNNVETNRRASAELYGIYGIYNASLPQNSSDQHYLICTDTAQGQRTGELIKDFLTKHGFSTVNIITPAQLSTKNTKAFADGTKELIKWLEEHVPKRSNDYEVIFNLVGGFKSLQGYMNTFGAFYADEVIYIFERSTDLIRIPRLPIQIDTTVIENHLMKFAMMAAGEMYPIEALDEVPGTLLEPLTDNGKTVAGLSAWGTLIWNRTKSELLIEELLPLPRLSYMNTFIRDFESETDTKKRLSLQETLAKVSYLLEKDNGDTQALSRDGGLQFKPLQGFRNIYTFRIARGIRVSCNIDNDIDNDIDNGTLKLRKYGLRNRVNTNP